MRSRWLDLTPFFFCKFMDLDFVLVNKHAKKITNLANIQPSWPHTWTITHTYNTLAKVKGLISQYSSRREYLQFYGFKELGFVLLPPVWDAGSSQLYNQQKIHWCIHCQTKKCLAQEHNTMSIASTTLDCWIWNPSTRAIWPGLFESQSTLL